MDLSARNYCVGCMQPKKENEKCPHCGYDEKSQAAAPHQLPPRTLLADRYMVGRALVEGAFSITYIGLDTAQNKVVIIKEYFPEGFVTRNHKNTARVSTLSDSGAECFRRGLSLFLDQAHVLVRFATLPGLVTVKTSFTQNDTAYMVTTYVPGRNILAFAERVGGKMKPGQVLSMMRPPMEALAEVHRAGLLHLDISPDALIVDDLGNARLVDFGSARVTPDTLDEKSQVASLRPGYSAPEQYEVDGKTGAYTDVYALAATTYRLITGARPPDARDRAEKDALAPPSALGIAMDPRQEEALMKALSPNASSRYDSVESFCQALYSPAPASASPEGEAASPVAGKDVKKKKRRNILIILLAAVLLAGVSLAAWFLLRSPGVTFSDPVFERMVRASLADPNGHLTADQLARVKSLSIDADTLTFGLTTPDTPEEYSVADFGDLENLQDLAFFTGLESLYIKDQRIADLAPIARLENLTYLALCHCDLSSLAGLSGMQNLTSLYLYDNNIQDLSPLLSQRQLTNLGFNQNAVVDITPLSMLTTLERVYMEENQVTDISPLRRVSGLEELWAGGNQITDISALSSLPNLAIVSLGGNPILDWSPVAEVPEVVGRPRSAMPIVFEDAAMERLIREALGRPEGDIMPSELDSVYRLTLRGDTLQFDVNAQGVFEAGPKGTITSLNDLSNFESLRELVIMDNPITDLSPLSALKNLSYLMVGNCDVEDLSPLGSMQSLRVLYLYENQITDLSPLRGLDLARLGVNDNQITDLSPLADMQNLTHLYINNNQVSDLSPLGGLESLTMLLAQNNPIRDWTPVSHVEEVYGLLSSYDPIAFEDEAFEGLLRLALDMPEGDITALDLSAIEALTIVGDSMYLELDEPYSMEAGEQGSIASLNDLAHFPALAQLYIADLPITNLTSVGSLSGLTYLAVINCDIRNIGPLENLQSLETLILRGGRVQDLSPLQGLSLHTLDLTDNAVSNLTPLAEMSTLKNLNLSGNSIRNIQPLGSLTGLSQANLSGNAVADWSPLSFLQQVEGRPAEDSPIVFDDPTFETLLRLALEKPEGHIFPAELSGIKRLALLGDALTLPDALPGEEDSAAEGSLATLSDLRHFTGLAELAIQSQPTSDLTPLAGLESLTALQIKNTPITDTTPLQGLSRLATLTLSDNQITNLSGLSALPLVHLNLSDNAVQDLSPLAEVTTLETLNLSQNQIADVSALYGLTSLQSLDLSGNAIEDPSPLDSLAKLETLDITGNPITDWQSLSALGQVTGRPAEYSPIAFADAAFERMLRTALDKPQDNITAAELSQVSDLALVGDTLSFTIPDSTETSGRGRVESLQDLTYFTSLTNLLVHHQPLADASPLSAFPGLATLSLQDTQVGDVSFLAELTALRALSLDNNQIKALPRLEMPGLASLSLSGNSITDLSSLSSLSALTTLRADGNALVDISPLSSLAGLEALSLSGNEIEDLSPLSGLSGLQALDATDNPVRDWSAVSQVPSALGRPDAYNAIAFADPTLERLLRQALGRQEGFITPAELSAVQSLTIIGDTLSLSLETPENYAPGQMGSLTTLSDLSYFTGLNDLYIQDQHVPDLAPLSGLPHLAYLSVSNCGVSDISPLSAMATLQYLYLYDNQITDLAPLSSLSLSRLAASRNGISDLSPLASVKTLSRLWLTGNQISDITPLSGLENLTHLYLSNNDIEDLSALSALPHLSTLYVTGNPVADFTPVAHVAEVYGATPETSPISFADPTFERLLREALGMPEGVITEGDLLSVTGITLIGDTLTLALQSPGAYAKGAQGTVRSLSDLRHFRSLEEVYVQDQPIQDLSPLALFPNLRYLAVNNAGISDLSPLSGLSELSYLYLYDNQIEDLSPLSGLTLSRLAASRNGVSDLSPLSEMKSLTHLWLSDNRITDITALSSLTRLSDLHLTGNQVADVSPLSKLSGLSTLYLTGNPVSDWAPVLHVENLFGFTDDALPIAFEDRTFERLLRQAMDKPEGSITAQDLFSITELEINPDALAFSVGALEATGRQGGITTLSDLQHFPRLARLIIRNHPLEDISAIAGLTQLNYLVVTGCGLRDIEALAGIPVERLGLTGNRIADITPLSTLENITHLYLGDNRIEDILPLAGLETLVEVNLVNNRIRHIDALGPLPRLEAVYLSGNPIENWLPVVHLPLAEGLPDDYQPLAFEDAAFEALLRAALGRPTEPIVAAELADITELSIVGDTLALSVTEAEQDLAAGEGAMATLSDLAHFTGLTTLYIRSQPVADIAPLSALTSLRYLTLTQCGISDLSPLAGLKIERLGLYENQIADLSPLASMSRLTHLYLGKNEIVDLTPLKNLTGLTHLNLTDNRVTDISALSALRGLEQLYLSGNPIADWTPVRRIDEVFGRPEE